MLNMDKKAVVRPISLPKGRRVLVVSDIHGNLPYLKGLLNKAGFSSTDILIVLGDILEKSTGGLDTLRYLMDLAKTHTVHFVQGNCDATPLGFLSGKWPEEIAARYGGFWGRKATWIEMAHRIGVPVASPADYPAAREAIREAYPEELAFLEAMPTILYNDDYLFVHGGVPREDRLEELSAWECMKNDDFLSKDLFFHRWVIVGHWPVALYDEKITQANPIIHARRHIVSIDGGCTLKEDGQLNALILPEEPGGEFTWVTYDGFPTVIAGEDQEASPDPLNIRWGHSNIEILEPGEEFTLVRHVESGRELPVLTDTIQTGIFGLTCKDTTDYLLPVKKGDTLSLVRQTSRGAIVKKDGITGWYLGSFT